MPPANLRIPLEDRAVEIALSPPRGNAPGLNPRARRNWTTGLADPLGDLPAAEGQALLTTSAASWTMGGMLFAAGTLVLSKER